MAKEPLRHVTAQTRIYLPGGSHGFRPGETVPLPESVAATLTAAEHLKPVPAAAVEPAPAPAVEPAPAPAAA